MDAHTDSVCCMRRANTRPTVLYTGSGDGEVIQWDLGISAISRRLACHQGFVRDICLTSNDRRLFTCGDDKTVKLWKADKESDTAHQVWHSPSLLYAVDHHWHKPMFVTC